MKESGAIWDGTGRAIAVPVRDIVEHILALLHIEALALKIIDQ